LLTDPSTVLRSPVVRHRTTLLPESRRDRPVLSSVPVPATSVSVPPLSCGVTPTHCVVMSPLPTDRVQIARPFNLSGVDYCGPFFVHYKIRGKKPHKVYLAIFCCFTTKAVHLEVVSDLTTQAFLAALKRFNGRRGVARSIYCDNATNFVGAKNELRELKTTIYSDEARETITKTCSRLGTEFHFIPLRAPHFGGNQQNICWSARCQRQT